MHPLSAIELLNAWERGLAQNPLQRALTLLAAARPETPPEQLAELSIGQRDACLLTLREWCFGPQLHSLATCPACNERVEVTFNVADIRVAANTAETEALMVSLEGHEVRFRLPNSLDLAALTGQEDLAANRSQLLQRCILSASCQGEEKSARQLPASVVDAVVEKMEQADPQANVQLALACPSCGHRWHAAFDVVAFFWREIEAWAQRILREVHTLAFAYGWREAEILNMSPWRRQFYLQMLSR